MINFTIKNDLKQKSYFFNFFCNFGGFFHLKASFISDRLFAMDGFPEELFF